MRILLCTIILLFTIAKTQAQYVYKIKADSVKITNDSCTAELIIENSTKNIDGFLFNKGNGRTEFRKVVTKINENKYVIGTDTVDIIGSSGGADSIVVSNGLTKTGYVIKLGGTLVDSTEVITAGNRLKFTGTITTDTITSSFPFTQKHQYIEGPNRFVAGVRATIRSGNPRKYLDTTSLRIGWSNTTYIAIDTTAVTHGSEGHRSVYIGDESGDSTTTGFQNVSVGSRALRRNKTGSYNTAIGSAALHNNQNASFQTAIGYTALLNIQSGQDNFAMGDFTFRNLDTSSYNVAIGSQAFTATTRANYNTAIGNYIRQRGARGDANTLVGYGIMRATGSHTDTADNNTALGFEALYSNRGGDGNVAIGYRAGYSELGSNQLYIDNSNTAAPLIKGDFLQDTLRVNGKLSVASMDSVNYAVPNLVTWDKMTGRFLSVPFSLAGGVGIANKDSLFWGTRGNAIVNPDSTFVGTTNNQPLYVKANNQHALTVSTNGNLGIGTKFPLYKVQISDQLGSSLAFNGRLSRPRDVLRFGGYLNSDDGQNVIISASSDSGAFFRNILVERDGNIGLGTSNSMNGWNVGKPALRIYYDGRVGVASNSFTLGNFGGPLNSSSFVMGVSNVTEYLEDVSYPNGQNYYYLSTILSSPTGANKRAPLFISGRELEFYTGAAPVNSVAKFTEAGNLILGTNVDEGVRLRVNGRAKIDSMNFIPNRDTVLTYDPVTKQIMTTRIAVGGSSTTKVKITADLTTTAYTSTTLADVTGLSFPVQAGTYYKFQFIVPFRSLATTNGIRLSLAIPAATVFSATAEIPIGADGTGSTFKGWITASNDVVLATAVQAINTDYIAIVEGVILASANGTIQLRYGSETTTGGVIIRNGAMGTIEPY